MDAARTHRYVDAALLRASAHLDDVVPPWWPEQDSNVAGRPDGGEERWCEWLRQAWARVEVVDAVSLASPALAEQVFAVCDGDRPGAVRTRRMALSLARYLVRMRGRATPFGLFAGTGPVRFGPAVEVRWSDHHRLRVRPDAAWLDAMIDRLESSPAIRRGLTVVGNELAMVRGDRLVVPRARSATAGALGELSVRHSVAVELVLRLAASPVPVPDVVEKVVAEFPRCDGSAVEAMVAALIGARVLITCLRPAFTDCDPLTHVVDTVSRIGAKDAPDVAADLAELHASRIAPGQRPDLTGSKAVDLGLGGDVVLPAAVAREAETAANALLRLSPQSEGHPSWRAYHSRFLDRFGVGGAVTVEHLVDPITGLGFPEHFSGVQATDRRLDERDEALLRVAQQAAWSGTREVVLDDTLLDLLAPARAAAVLRPPHLDMCVELQARSRAAIDAGEFTVAVVGIGATGLATGGRFLDLLTGPDDDRAVSALRGLPTATDGAVAAQLSFPPLMTRVGNVARVRSVLSEVLPVGEHPRNGVGLSVGDLVVTADHQGLYLVSRSRGVVIEPVLAHAVARQAMPALVRFLAELPRATTAGLSLFDWGVAACLPFRPRLRYGRAVLVGARWRLDPRLLPGSGATGAAWRTHLSAVREQLALPDVVSVGTGDRRLRLDLDATMDAELLREHLRRADGPITVAEATSTADHGWLDGRAHEILIPLADTTPPAPSPAVLRRARSAALIGREHGNLPGSTVLSARLACHPDLMDTIIIQHLSELLDTQDPTLRWWYLRGTGRAPHLRLRLHTGRYGATAEDVGRWAARLRSNGLAGDLVLDTYRPELARYTHDGGETAMDAAETVFAADSVAARAQLCATTAGDGPHPVALTAASVVDLTRALTGGRRAGAEWSVRRADLTADARVRDRRLFEQVRALTSGAATDHAELLGRHVAEVTRAWDARVDAVRRYLDALRQEPVAEDGMQLRDSTVVSLLHLHHVRVLGPDPAGEALCHRLARSVALAALACDPSSEVPT